jgi:hypothetical protein
VLHCLDNVAVKHTSRPVRQIAEKPRNPAAGWLNIPAKFSAGAASKKEKPLPSKNNDKTESLGMCR